MNIQFIDVQKYLSIFAGILFVIGFLPYGYSILKGETKPAKASWIIWATLDTITLAGMSARSSINGQIVGAVLGAWIIVALALKYGTSDWTRLDMFCLGGALIGIGLWRFFDSPTAGLTTSVVVVFFGSIPTFRSAWNDPSKEDKVAWTIFWISCVCGVVAVPEWNLDNAMQPVTFLMIESIMMYLLYVEPLRLTIEE